MQAISVRLVAGMEEGNHARILVVPKISSTPTDTLDTVERSYDTYLCPLYLAQSTAASMQKALRHCTWSIGNARACLYRTRKPRTFFVCYAYCAFAFTAAETCLRPQSRCIISDDNTQLKRHKLSSCNKNNSLLALPLTDCVAGQCCRPHTSSPA